MQAFVAANRVVLDPLARDSCRFRAAASGPD